MLKRPSSRRNTKNAEVQINLVPILDAMVCLISFLLFSMSFLVLVHIESPFPTASTKDLQEKLKQKPLQLTVSLHDKDVEVWSPFERIKSKTIPNLADTTPDLKTLHATLIEIKQNFKDETKVVFAPYPGATYDTLIAIMDTMREMTPTDPPMFQKNAKTGLDEPMKQLFPEVVYGNLLGSN